jgi:hypothetical protein
MPGTNTNPELTEPSVSPPGFWAGRSAGRRQRSGSSAAPGGRTNALPRDLGHVAGTCSSPATRISPWSARDLSCAETAHLAGAALTSRTAPGQTAALAAKNLVRLCLQVSSIDDERMMLRDSLIEPAGRHACRDVCTGRRCGPVGWCDAISRGTHRGRTARAFPACTTRLTPANKGNARYCGQKMGDTGLEPVTSALSRRRSPS